MKMFQILAVLTFVSAQSFAAATERQFTCTENVKGGTGVIRGHVIEEGFLRKENGKFSLEVARIGYGILSDHGDGTGDASIIGDAVTVDPSWEHKATSAQWKDAVPFLLPAEEKGTHVLYVHPEAFKTGKEDFKVRLKIEKSGKVKNLSFDCYQI